MTEQTRKNITQVLLPGLFLFGALGLMYGPTYFQYVRSHWLDYSIQRESLLGPVCYDVRLKSGFVSEVGDNWQVYVITDMNPEKSEASNRQELLLVDQWGSIVKRDLQTDVGAIQSTHLVPQDGYAMLEVIRHVPGDLFAAEIVHYQVTSQQIAMVESETKRFNPGWRWNFGPPHEGPPGPRDFDHRWRGRGRGDDRDPDFRNRGDADADSRPRRGPRPEPEYHTGDVAQSRNDRSRAASKVNGGNFQRSKYEEDMQRSRPMGSDDKGLLDVGSLGGA